MTELRTLKDLKIYQIHVRLREETKKQIKELKEDYNYSPSMCEDYRKNYMVIKWIEHLFNLTEDNLK